MRFDIRLMEERTAGRLEERDHTRLLVAALREAGRLDELPAALEDDKTYRSLLIELGIVSSDEYDPEA